MNLLSALPNVGNCLESSGAFNTRFFNAHISQSSYKTNRGVRSRFECATICLKERVTNSKCSAYSYNAVQESCDLYVTDTSQRYPERAGIYVYEEPATFTTVEVGGRPFHMFMSISKKPYTEARAYCYSIGGRLVEFDSQDEYTAAQLVTDGRRMGKYYYVGFNDYAMPPTWVTDSDLLPVDESLVLWKGHVVDNIDNRSGEPAHCAALQFTPKMKVNERDCLLSLYFLCERN